MLQGTRLGFAGPPAVCFFDISLSKEQDILIVHGRFDYHFRCMLWLLQLIYPFLLQYTLDTLTSTILFDLALISNLLIPCLSMS